MTSSSIRIYYECYEQAKHFLVPAVSRADPSAEITLVRLSRLRNDSRVAARLHDAFAFKNPDAVISRVDSGSGTEIPLAFLEFSTAVETQDHDMQRFDAFIAASMAQAPFIKVYAKRQSRAAGGHGGQQNYDRLSTYKILLQRLSTPGFEVEWPLEHDGFTAVRQDDFKACPPVLPQLSELLAAIFEAVQGDAAAASSVLARQETLPAWARRQLEDARGPLPVHADNGRSTRFFRQGQDWCLKFNRYGHAMDPERGMAWFLRASVGEPLVGMLVDSGAATPKQALGNFARATGLTTEGLAVPATSGTLDVTEALDRSALNRPGFAIFWNLKSFTIVNEGRDPLLTLTWTPGPRYGWAPQGSAQPRTSLRARTDIGEDEVTYTVAHDVLRMNGFELHSLSYPGAQGDFALLEGSGRRTLRTYIDVIAVKPGVALALTESKGKFSRASVASDAAKVVRWRDDPPSRALLREAVSRSGLLKEEPILSGVAYARSQDVLDDFQGREDLDFVVVVREDGWRVWHSGTPTDPVVLNATRGPTSFGDRSTY